jgi:putative acetyltransferase
MDNITIRSIEPRDNAAIASIIRESLVEFGAARPGTVYYDTDTDRLSHVFQIARGGYFIVEHNGNILGGAGIYPTPGLGDTTCELVKMYLTAAARGRGLGRALIERCIALAQQNGYSQIYLETMPELTLAIPLYEKTGFRKLSAPMGQSGHFGCGIWMVKEI